MAAVFHVIKRSKASSRRRADERVKGWRIPTARAGPIRSIPNKRHRAEHLHAPHRDEGRQAREPEFETIPNVKDPWKELNPAK